MIFRSISRHIFNSFTKFWFKAFFEVFLDIFQVFSVRELTTAYRSHILTQEFFFFANMIFRTASRNILFFTIIGGGGTCDRRLLRPKRSSAAQRCACFCSFPFGLLSKKKIEIIMWRTVVGNWFLIWNGLMLKLYDETLLRQ